MLALMAMGQISLRTVTRTQGNNRALKDGTVSPDGISFDFVEVPVLVQGFRRMVRSLEFDVCEMALTTYLVAKAHGVRFTAIPAFLVRGFHHNAITVDSRHGITHPRDLEGTRVGVNRGYTVTTGVWARSILATEYGVDLTSIDWVTSSDEHVATFQRPDNVHLAPADRTLEEMLATGELSAIVGGSITSDHARPLIPDPASAAHRALEQRGFWPINHLIVIRDDLLHKHPNLGAQVFDAFAASKQHYLDELRPGLAPIGDPTDDMHRKVMELTGWHDPLPYGLAPNRDTLEELVAAATAQGILDRTVRLEDLFTSDTVGVTG